MFQNDVITGWMGGHAVQDPGRLPGLGTELLEVSDFSCCFGLVPPGFGYIHSFSFLYYFFLL